MYQAIGWFSKTIELGYKMSFYFLLYHTETMKPQSQKRLYFYVISKHGNRHCFSDNLFICLIIWVSEWQRKSEARERPSFCWLIPPPNLLIPRLAQPQAKSLKVFLSLSCGWQQSSIWAIAHCFPGAWVSHRSQKFSWP